MPGPSSSPPAEWTRAYAERVVDDFLQSGMTAEAFAQKHGFSAPRVAWLREQGRRRGQLSKPRIVELVPAGRAAGEPEAAPLGEAGGPSAPLRVLCPSGHTILVEGDLTAGLTATFRALREVTC
jgi:hypothetical protein